MISTSKVTKGKYNKECLEYLSQWYGVSQREVMDYLEILSKDDVINILMKYGLTDKEAKVIEMNTIKNTISGIIPTIRWITDIGTIEL